MPSSITATRPNKQSFCASNALTVMQSSSSVSERAKRFRRSSFPLRYELPEIEALYCAYFYSDRVTTFVIASIITLCGMIAGSLAYFVGASAYTLFMWGLGCFVAGSTSVLIRIQHNRLMRAISTNVKVSHDEKLGGSSIKNDLSRTTITNNNSRSTSAEVDFLTQCLLLAHQDNVQTSTRVHEVLSGVCICILSIFGVAFFMSKNLCKIVRNGQHDCINSVQLDGFVGMAGLLSVMVVPMRCSAHLISLVLADVFFIAHWFIPWGTYATTSYKVGVSLILAVQLVLTVIFGWLGDSTERGHFELLCSLLEQRNEAKRTSEYTHRVMESMIPPHIALRIARGEAVRDTIRGCTVCMLGIVAFRQVAARLPAAEIAMLLHFCAATMDNLIKEHDGTTATTTTTGIRRDSDVHVPPKSRLTKVHQMGDRYLLLCTSDSSRSAHSRVFDVLTRLYQVLEEKSAHHSKMHRCSSLSSEDASTSDLLPISADSHQRQRHVDTTMTMFSLALDLDDLNLATQALQCLCAAVDVGDVMVASVGPVSNVTAVGLPIHWAENALSQHFSDPAVSSSTPLMDLRLSPKSASFLGLYTSNNGSTEHALGTNDAIVHNTPFSNESMDSKTPSSCSQFPSCNSFKVHVIPSSFGKDLSHIQDLSESSEASKTSIKRSFDNSPAASRDSHAAPTPREDKVVIAHSTVANPLSQLSDSVVSDSGVYDGASCRSTFHPVEQITRCFVDSQFVESELEERFLVMTRAPVEKLVHLYFFFAAAISTVSFAVCMMESVRTSSLVSSPTFWAVVSGVIALLGNILNSLIFFDRYPVLQYAVEGLLLGSLLTMYGVAPLGTLIGNGDVLWLVLLLQMLFIRSPVLPLYSYLGLTVLYTIFFSIMQARSTPLSTALYSIPPMIVCGIAVCVCHVMLDRRRRVRFTFRIETERAEALLKSERTLLEEVLASMIPNYAVQQLVVRARKNSSAVSGAESVAHSPLFTAMSSPLVGLRGCYFASPTTDNGAWILSITLNTKSTAAATAGVAGFPHFWRKFIDTSESLVALASQACRGGRIFAVKTCGDLGIFSADSKEEQTTQVALLTAGAVCFMRALRRKRLVHSEGCENEASVEQPWVESGLVCVSSTIVSGPSCGSVLGLASLSFEVFGPAICLGAELGRHAPHGALILVASAARLLCWHTKHLQTNLICGSRTRRGCLEDLHVKEFPFAFEVEHDDDDGSVVVGAAYPWRCRGIESNTPVHWVKY